MRTLVSRALAQGAVIALPLLLACSGDQSAANPSAGGADASATAAPVEAIPAGLARADFDLFLDVSGSRVDHQHAFRHQLLRLAREENAGGFRQLFLRVHAETDAGPSGDRRDLLARLLAD